MAQKKKKLNEFETLRTLVDISGADLPFIDAAASRKNLDRKPFLELLIKTAANKEKNLQNKQNQLAINL